MPITASIAIILSQRQLVQELLGELLRSRCGAHVVARVATLDQPPSRMPEAGVLIYDNDGFEPAALEAFLSQLRAARPAMRIVPIDESSPEFSGKAIVDAVRGSLSLHEAPHESLTPLELQVMLGIASGYRNADLARHMRRSSKTIEKHRANVSRKLGLRTVAQLTAYAIHHGLLRAEAIIARRRQS